MGAITMRLGSANGPRRKGENTSIVCAINRSIEMHAALLHHLGPACRLSADEGGELGRRAARRIKPDRFGFGFERWIVEDFRRLGRELVDNGGRSAAPSDE